MLRNKTQTQLREMIKLSLGGVGFGLLCVISGLLMGPVMAVDGLTATGALIAVAAGVIALMAKLALNDLLVSGKGKVAVLDGCQIAARFAINRIGETLFDADYVEFDDPKTKLFVRLNRPNLPSLEVRTNQHVWLACGEGMYGSAHVDGDWMGRFEQRVPPTPQGNPYIN